MKIKRFLSISLLLTILIYIVLSTYLAGSNVSYAGQVSAGTLTTDLNTLDENYYPGYKSLITSLQASHSNYTIKLYYTGLDWNEVINAEYQGHGYSPTNLFTVKTNYEGMWYCPICGTKTYDNGSLCCASKEAIAYMMDPRNSLNESDIFQFKTLEGSDVTIDDIARVVSGKGSYINNSEAIQAIYDASVTYGINGYFLVAKIINEHGNSGSTLTAGNGYNGNYVGYYNYFNVNSYGNGTSAIINSGLSYAQSKGWNSIRASILGGAEILKQNYMTTRGQITLYYQKFNVVYTSALFTYQYQSNIMAAQSQGTSLKSYYGSNISTQNMTFIIPVYENMPASCARPSTTTTNSISYESGVVTNVSSSLKVRASASINGLAIGKLNNNESIKILQRATSQVDGYYWDLVVSNADGTYGYAARIVGGETCISSTGSSGTSSGATASGSSSSSSSSSSSTVTKTEKVSISGSYYVSTPIVTYDYVVSQNSNAVVKNANGETITSGNIGTGYTVTIGDSTYTVVKKGDVNSDGNVNILDTIVMLNYLKGNTTLEGAKLEAAKVSNQSTSTITDVVKVLNYIKGSTDISF